MGHNFRICQKCAHNAVSPHILRLNCSQCLQKLHHVVEIILVARLLMVPRPPMAFKTYQTHTDIAPLLLLPFCSCVRSSCPKACCWCLSTDWGSCQAVLPTRVLEMARSCERPNSRSKFIKTGRLWISAGSPRVASTPTIFRNQTEKDSLLPSS